MTLIKNLTRHTELKREVHGIAHVEKTIAVTPESITKTLLLIAFLLLCFHELVVSIDFFQRYTPGSTLSTLANNFYGAFHLAGEGNIPTYYSSFLLGAASFLLYVIFKTEENRSGRWLSLSLIFLLLSLDELAQLHERFANPTGAKLESYFGNVPSWLAWGWVLPYAALAVAAGLYFFRFVFSLARKTRLLFILSGCVYVFAALILEMLEAHFEVKFGPENRYNALLYPIEEIMEMTGVIIFIYALLDYLRGNRKGASLSLAIKVNGERDVL